MKILNIVTEGRFGGPQRRILEVSKGLREKGMETIVVMPNYDSGQFQSVLKENNIPFEAIPIHRVTKDWKHLLGFLFFFIPELFRLMRLIKKHDIDIVHCNGSFQYKGIIAAKLTGTRSIWHLNDTYMPGYILLIFRFVRFFFADTFIASSIRTRAFYTQSAVSPKLRMDIVLPPVNTSQFNPETVAAALDILEAEGVKIVTVGNINPIKGYPTFVKMVAEVNRRSKQKIQFFAVGKILDNQKKLTASLMEMVKELGIDNLTFTGGRGDIPAVLKAADIFVCPSVSESGPMSVFEAMAMQCPIVSTDVGDVRGLFGKDEAGLIVPVDEPKAMAEAVIRLVENEGLRNQIGQSARKKALQAVDVSCCVLAHEKVYKDVKAKNY